MRTELNGAVSTGAMSSTSQDSAQIRKDRVMYFGTSPDDMRADSGWCAGPGVAAAISLLEGLAAMLNKHLGRKLLLPQQCMASCYDGHA